MKKRALILTVVALILATVLGGSPVLAQTVQQPEATPPQAEKAAVPAQQAEKAAVPAPDPRQVLQKMCDFLKSQQQFTYKAEVADDQVYQGGKKLQYGIDMETYVRRPDRLRVNAEGDLVDKQFFFNGKTITLYDKDHNVYGVMEVPPDIESALEKANKEFGVRVALTDLASPKLWETLNKRLKRSIYVGLSKVRGVPCHHLALDGDTAHVQVWIEAGDKPIPRKVVMIDEKAPGSPEWMAYLYDWNFSPQLQDSVFVFTPPEGAQKIKFMPLKAGPASKTKAGKQGGKS
jgi:hypothetical protein